MFRTSIFAALLASWTAASTALAAAEDSLPYEVQHWSVWVADPTIEQMNASGSYASALPVLVQSPRVQRYSAEPDRPRPINVLAFYGNAAPNVEVDLRVRSGSFLSFWPAAESSAARLRWLNQNLVERLPEGARMLTISNQHWFNQARGASALYLHTTSDQRAERFLAYDVQLSMPVPIKLEGGPDEYKVTNLTQRNLHDVAVCSATAEGTRVGWATAIEPGAARAARVLLSKPLPAGDELNDVTTDQLTELLIAAGLHKEQAWLIVATYRDAIFAGKGLTALVRLEAAALDEQTPVVFYPLPAKSTRVGLVIVRRIDPQIAAEVDRLVAELASSNYEQREVAQRRLMELGALAYPSVRAALKHSDPEVVFRAETILLDQSQPISR